MATAAVRDILSWYGSDNPGTRANLARMLNHGRLGGTGKMVILPVDQGFEHGPARSFAINPPAYDPRYHPALAIEAGLSAYAAPLGMIEIAADAFPAEIPLILKVNSANSWATTKDQAVTASVEDALRLGCSAIGFTIYPGSEHFFELVEEVRELTLEAKAAGLAVVVWSYPRGGELSKDGELALDVGAYAAHMAALIGAHIIKVKLPSAHIEQKDARKAYEGRDYSSLADRVRHVMESSFGGRRIVVFSGGATKGEDAVFSDAIAIRDGGGHGSIIGRNTFQRERSAALAMLDRIIAIYRGEA
ncbi:MAG: class I fructose-bisphosphate aldolase [Sphingomonadaceae bacterium]|nr:class I fructose-bisphosphate aldolase [Sphingomonadaceae bacterium]